jgi:hypothetical protein
MLRYEAFTANSSSLHPDSCCSEIFEFSKNEFEFDKNEFENTREKNTFSLYDNNP